MSARFSKPAGRPAARTLPACGLLCAVLAAAAAPAASADTYLSAEHRIATLVSGTAPEVYGATALLAYSQERAARYVALRFRDDPTLRVYSRVTRQPGAEGQPAAAFAIFVLTLDLSERELPQDGRLLYRICVDGTWMTDPFNPERLVDPRTRVAWSVLAVEPARVSRLESPEWTPNGAARFHYVGDPGRVVALVGSFNRWDPYMHRLVEVSPGSYSIEVRLPAGPQPYMFLVDGVLTPDMLNPKRGMDAWGRRVCVAEPQPEEVSALRPAGR